MYVILFFKILSWIDNSLIELYWDFNTPVLSIYVFCSYWWFRFCHGWMVDFTIHMWVLLDFVQFLIQCLAGFSHWMVMNCASYWCLVLEYGEFGELCWPEMLMYFTRLTRKRTKNTVKSRMAYVCKSVTWEERWVPVTMYMISTFLGHCRWMYVHAWWTVLKELILVRDMGTMYVHTLITKGMLIFLGNSNSLCSTVQ